MPAPKSIRSRTSGTIRVPWRNALAIAFASSLLAVGSNAATLTWTGLAGDNKISTAGNWTPSQAPVSGVALVFSGTVGLLPNLGAAGLSVSGLTFSAGSGAFTLTGPGAYAINTGGITDSAASLETIANGISLAGAQTWASTGGNLLFDGATINLGAQTLTLATGTHAITISNAISGTGKLIENGTGALTLTGSSTFSGGVTLSSGTAILGNGAALGSGALTLGGGSINVTNGSQTLANAVSFAANTTFVGSGGNLTLTGTAALTGNRTLTVNAGVVTFANTLSSGTGSYTLTENGSGTLVLDGTNTFGNFTLSSGTVIAANSSALGTATLSLGTGTLASTGGATSFSNAITLAGSPTFSGSNAITLTGTATMSASETVTINNPAVTFNDVISQPGAIAFALTESGTGALILTGSVANTFTGAMTVNSGTLFLDKTAGVNAIGGALTVGNTTSAAGSAIAELQASNQTPAAAAVAVQSSGILNIQSYTDTIGALTMTGGSIIGTGTLNLGGNVTVSATGTATASVSANLNLNGNRTFTINANGVVTAVDLTVSGAIADGSAVSVLTKAGAGTLALNGSNSYSGGTTLSAGGLSLGTSNSAGTGPLSLGTAMLQSSGGSLTLNNAVTLAGNTIFGGTGALVFSGSSTLTASRTLTINNGSVTFSGPIGQSASGFGITESGTGTLEIGGTAANSFTGIVTVNGGSLLLADSAGTAMGGNLVVGSGTAPALAQWLAANQMAATGSVTVNAGGVLDLNGNNQTISGLTVGGGASITMESGTLTLNGNVTHNGTGSTPATIAGTLNLGGATRTFTIGKSTASQDLVITAIILNGGLTKSGAGLMALDATNSYTGNTTINQGTLQLGINNAIGSASAISVSNGATLDMQTYSDTIGALTMTGGSIIGSGTLNLGGNVTVSAAGTATASISPNVTLNGNQTFTVNANGVAGAMDLTISGPIANGATTGILTKAGAGFLALQRVELLQRRNNAERRRALAWHRQLSRPGTALARDGNASIRRREPDVKQRGDAGGKYHFRRHGRFGFHGQFHAHRDPHTYHQ
jgi:fibronectin-binding autotransporter adhesin